MIRSSQPHEEEPHSDRRSRVPGLWLYTRSLPFAASFGILKEKTEELEKAEASLALLTVTVTVTRANIYEQPETPALAIWPK